MVRFTVTKWAISVIAILSLIFCLRFEAFTRLGIVPFSYAIGHYEPGISDPPKAGQRERWFSCGYTLPRVKVLYSLIFGMPFDGTELGKKGFKPPTVETIKGRRFVLCDFLMQIRNGYYLQLYEGYWLDDSSKKRIVLMSVNNGGLY